MPDIKVPKGISKLPAPQEEHPAKPTDVPSDYTEGEILIEDVKAEPVKENTTVSLFSWYFEFTNQGIFHRLSEPLKEFGITRIYQLFPVEYFKEPEVSVTVQSLSDIGIETVLLLGDKNWVIDGLTEYYQIIDALTAYNETAGPEQKINSVALDIEAHSLKQWQKNPNALFQKFTELMKQAKEYANQHNLKVIQVIPTYLDDIDTELFTTFLLECCDELSIMNYRKDTALTAIENEVALCAQYGIPVETVFETMPSSDTYGVTEDLTYHYDGIDILKENVAKLKAQYGPTLGTAFHHYSTLYKMYTGTYLAEIYLYGGKDSTLLTAQGQPQNPGFLLLHGEDGSQIMASPYWPNGKKKNTEYCWLAAGVQEGITYTLLHYNLFQTTVPEETVTFTAQTGDIKLKAEVYLY